MIIYNAKLVTMAGDDIENGFIEIKNGKISNIGTMQQLKAKPSSNDIDATGLTLYPGFIDAHCHVGVWEDGLGFEGDDGNEDSDPCTPQLRAADMINPRDRCFQEGLEAGVTCVAVGMGSANVIGGSFVAMKTGGGKSIDSRIIKQPLCMKMALGENPKVTYHAKNQAPATRMATAALIREQLSKTKRYLKDLEEYNAKLGTEDEISPPDYDSKCEALIPLLKREIKAHIHCHRADDIFTAVRISKEFDLRYTLIHATEAWLIADELSDAECVIGPVICDRSKPELKNQNIENAAVIAKNNISFAICTDHPEVPLQYLPLSAGVCIKGGLSKRQALEAITITPAKILELDHRIGSLEIGKDADIVGFDAPFYDVLSEPKLVVLDGNIVKRK